MTKQEIIKIIEDKEEELFRKAREFENAEIKSEDNEKLFQWHKDRWYVVYELLQQVKGVE